MTRVLAAHARYNERWHRTPSPNANTVRPLMFVAEQSERHDAPCFRCGARDECRHRKTIAA